MNVSLLLGHQTALDGCETDCLSLIVGVVLGRLRDGINRPPRKPNGVKSKILSQVQGPNTNVVWSQVYHVKSNVSSRN